MKDCLGRRGGWGVRGNRKGRGRRGRRKQGVRVVVCDEKIEVSSAVSVMRGCEVGGDLPRGGPSFLSPSGGG